MGEVADPTLFLKKMEEKKEEYNVVGLSGK